MNLSDTTKNILRQCAKKLSESNPLTPKFAGGCLIFGAAAGALISKVCDPENPSCIKDGAIQGFAAGIVLAGCKGVVDQASQIYTKYKAEKPRKFAAQ